VAVTAPNLPGPVEVVVPEALAAGVYANGVGMWSTETEFTLDFLVNLPMSAPDSQPQVQVVARVKVPPAMVFKLLQGLANAQDLDEKQWGRIADPKGYTQLGREGGQPSS
jgi:hypothetical protein